MARPPSANSIIRNLKKDKKSFEPKTPIASEMYLPNVSSVNDYLKNKPLDVPDASFTNLKADHIAEKTAGHDVVIDNDVDLGNKELTANKVIAHSFSTPNDEQELEFDVGVWTLGAVDTQLGLFITSDGDSGSDTTTITYEKNNAYITNLGTSAQPFDNLFIGTIDLGTNTITDGNMTGNWDMNAGNITDMGNITGTDVDLALGTGNITTTGDVSARDVSVSRDILGPNGQVIEFDTAGLIRFSLFGETLMDFNLYTASTSFPFSSSIYMGKPASTADTSLWFMSSGNDGRIIWDQSDKEFDFTDAKLTTADDYRILSDTGKFICGTGSDFEIFFDGTYGRLDGTGDAIRIGNTITNSVEIGSTGDLTFIGSAGLPYGCIEGTDETVTCTTQNTWYQVTFDTAGPSNNTTVSTANNDITVDKTGDYATACTACLHTSNAQDIEVQIKTENGTVDKTVHLFQTTGVAGKIENLAGSCIVPITGTDTLELWVRCTSAGTTDVIFDHVNLHCSQVGG